MMNVSVMGLKLGMVMVQGLLGGSADQASPKVSLQNELPEGTVQQAALRSERSEILAGVLQKAKKGTLDRQHCAMVL